jgi:fatty acid desaturase
MKAPQEAMIAYLATLAAIVALSGAGALAVMFGPQDKTDQVMAALAFISAGVTGLIGVIGTFRPKGHEPKDDEQ